jgi:hypothetical protein
VPRLRLGILFAQCSIYFKPTWDLLPGQGVSVSGACWWRER